jgi:formyltetrahydrofolate-dependent phosphoribosylglycinamide formyltransferase
MNERLRIAVLASGRGTNLRAILDACDAGTCHARVVGVLSDKKNAGALEIARERAIDTKVVALRDHADRGAWDRALAEAIASVDPELIVLAGFMKIVGPAVLARYEGRIVNVHPSLLPSFPGADGAALALAAGVTISGCTVHLVDAGLDSGKILAQAAVPVLPGDDRDRLQHRIQAQEYWLLPRVIDWIARGQIGSLAADERAFLRSPDRAR